MSIKLQEGEKVLYEGKPEDKISIMWFFTKVISGAVYASFISFFVLMFLYMFFVVMPAGKNDAPFPGHLFRIVLTLFPVYLIIMFI